MGFVCLFRKRLVKISGLNLKNMEILGKRKELVDGYLIFLRVE